MAGNHIAAKQEKNNTLKIAVVVLALLVLVLSALLLFGKNNEAAPEAAPSVIGGGDPIPEEEPAEKNQAGIDLPGYAYMEFKAGQKQQDMIIPNPPQNTCLVRMSLILEDGTVIWTSELVEPGYYCSPIELIAPMERGEYKNVTLQYECFTNDKDRTPLNGAQTKLSILAK